MVPKIETCNAFGTFKSARCIFCKLHSEARCSLQGVQSARMSYFETNLKLLGLQFTKSANITFKLN